MVLRNNVSVFQCGTIVDVNFVDQTHRVQTTRLFKSTCHSDDLFEVWRVIYAIECVHLLVPGIEMELRSITRRARSDHDHNSERQTEDIALGPIVKIRFWRCKAWRQSVSHPSTADGLFVVQLIPRPAASKVAKDDERICVPRMPTEEYVGWLHVSMEDIVEIWHGLSTLDFIDAKVTKSESLCQGAEDVPAELFGDRLSSFEVLSDHSIETAEVAVFDVQVDRHVRPLADALGFDISVDVGIAMVFQFVQHRDLAKSCTIVDIVLANRFAHTKHSVLALHEDRSHIHSTSRAFIDFGIVEVSEAFELHLVLRLCACHFRTWVSSRCFVKLLT